MAILTHCNQKLIEAVRALVVPFIKAADDAASERASGDIVADAAGRKNNVLVDFQKPQEVANRIKFSLPNQGQGKEGLLAVIQQVLENSVNTWDQGFLDKLYASTNAVGSPQSVNNTCAYSYYRLA